jgi:putative Mn2+ efflux pump MntP
MSSWEILAVAVGLAMDATAVSLGAGATAGSGARATFRLAFHFGLFQFMMPVAGWLLGSTVAPYIQAVDHWIALGLLGFVGGRMILEGVSHGEHHGLRDPSRGLTLVMLSVATSIDALAVGLTLAMLEVGIWWASVTIGVITGCLSAIGVRVGCRLGRSVGRGMEVGGGIVLLAIGIRILVQHMG